jgi:hypothetical protein
MRTIERGPAFVAQQTRFLRKMLRLTQENLADTADLTPLPLDFFDQCASLIPVKRLVNRKGVASVKTRAGENDLSRT